MLRATVVIAVITMAVVPMASALTPAQVGRCLDLSGRTSLRLSSVDDGLGLSGDQIREAKTRVDAYWRGRASTWDLAGLGFTAEQETTFTRRANAAMARSSWPLGSPCAAFKNRRKVIKRVKALLVYNGFRPAMSFTIASPRQITFRAIQDGVEFFGVVVKTAPRQILVKVDSTHSGSSSVRVSLNFVA